MEITGVFCNKKANLRNHYSTDYQKIKKYFQNIARKLASIILIYVNNNWLFLLVLIAAEDRDDPLRVL